MGILLVLVCLVAHPWWLASLGGWIARSQNLEIQTIRVDGFSRYQLTGVRYEVAAGRTVELAELSVYQPLRWLWQLRRNGTEPWLLARGLDIVWGDVVTEATTVGGTAVSPSQLMGLWQRVASWLPIAEVEDLRIELVDAEVSLQVDTIVWSHGALELVGARTAQVVLGEAAIGPTEGQARLMLRRDLFEFAVQAEGRLQTAQLDETARMAIAGSLGTDGFGVDQLTLQWPGMDAHLDRPLRGSVHNWRFEAPASFYLQTDLSVWTAGWASGEIAATLLWQGWVEDSLDATITFSLDAHDLVLPWLQVRSAKVEAVLDAVQLQVQSAHILLAQGSSLDVHGWFDHRQQSVLDGNLELSWQGQDFAYWLPEWALGSSGGLRAQLAGPLNELRHSGGLRTNRITLPNGEILQLRLRWQGRHDAIEQGTLVMHHPDLEMGMDFSFHRQGPVLNLHAPKYRIQHRQLPELLSTEPLRLRVTVNDTGPDVALQGLAMSDGIGGTQLRASLFLEQMRLRAVNLFVHQLNTRDLRAFIGAEIPEVSLQELAVQLQSQPHLDSAAVTGSLKLLGYHQMNEQSRLQLAVNADLATDGLRITEGQALVDGSRFLQVEGLVPLTVTRSDGLYRHNLDYRARMRATARFSSHPLLLDWLNTVANIDIKGPEGEIDLTGNLRAPNGRIALTAAHVGTPFAIAGEGITIDQPVLHAELTPTELRLIQAKGAVRHEPFAISAQLPMRAADWEALFSSGALPDWRSGSLDLTLDAMRLETLAAIFPELLGRSGSLSVHAGFSHRQGLSGVVEIRNLQTRPLPNGAVVDRLNARLQLEGETASLQTFSAFISGQPIQLDGGFSFPDWQTVAYDLHLRGQQLPFWRQDQILLRGDLDLRLNKQAGATAPLLSGEIGFRDSIFIQEVNLFAGGTRAGGRIRPPFFSIEEPPFADWHLDLHLRGRDFLRVQSPFLLGRVSADFRLRGTLGDPLLYGSAFMEQGSILFNFGTLQVQRAQARIPLENPFLIELDVLAQGRSFGYDITLQLEGTEQEPRVQFSSNPALGQREILQLLVAGVMPEQAGGGAQSGQRYALLLGRNVWQQLFPGTGGSFAERLEIRNGRDISERGRDTYELEFRFNNRITLHGEYDRFDDFNFGIRWHLFTR